ncbi:MAG TPA: hypothetical protein PLV21_11255 [Cyclobacteriaceae bacterium]|nr:hypothetical protein [Cyclobacteriaceae bacterium]HRJ82457.1 hypothetical protein [Cyclobacteriaceae bacterium]
MDNLQFWLYVIIGVIYLITQVRKKAKEQAPPQRPVKRQEATTPQFRPEPQSQTTTPKPISFEDLLREITEAKAPKTEVPYEPYKQPEYVDYDDDVADEEETYEPVVTDYRKTDPIYKKYEDAKAYDYAGSSLEQTLKLENVDMRFGRFNEFESEKSRNLLEEYTQDLRDPDGFKKAVILSEILTTKHF